ncbi:MAG: PKD domain-containing protein [bacterium]|nr:PKD domain-containing protein [bacterium]
MTRIFPHFPQDYNFQVVYKQCQATTKDMQHNPNRDNFNSFFENCKNPLASLVSTIQGKYTIRASASLNPSSGPAPLTVTFDARASSDPSNETIPSRNYFWYYRDIDGTDKPIGYGPVVSYKFNESGTYLVHLTVRSSNSGIFDGEATVSVNVSPKSANVIIYANGKKMEKQKAVKIGVQEAKK